MTTIIKIKRGLDANLPKLETGEIAFTTDKKGLHIGTEAGNEKLIPESIKLSDAIDSTSVTEVATANAVKKAYDKGVEALNRANTANNKTITKTDVGLSNVDNVKQMPISGGTFSDYREKLTTLTSGTINLSLGNVFSHTLSANVAYSISGATSNTAHSFTLFIAQGATVRTITFPSSVKWQNVPDMSAISKTYILSFVTINGGTTWFGVLGGAF